MNNSRRVKCYIKTGGSSKRCLFNGVHMEVLVVNFLIKTFDYLTFILFAYHIKQTFRNVFHYVGFDTLALLF